MTKKTSNSFTAAALNLCMSEEELKKRLDAYIELTTIKVERDRAIESAYFQNEKLTDFAKAVVYALKPIDDENGKLKKHTLKMLLQHARNLANDPDEVEVPAIYKEQPVEEETKEPESGETK